MAQKNPGPKQQTPEETGLDAELHQLMLAVGATTAAAPREPKPAPRPASGWKPK